MGQAKSSAEEVAPSPPQTAASGELFLYNEDYGYAAFEVGRPLKSCRALVCLGGLTDGLLSLRYLPALAAALSEDGWRVVQPVLQSSYSGWGTSSLDTDVEDLDRLLQFLASTRGITEVALLGHSTGCQDVVRYLKTGKSVSMVVAAILQAPVSDREALALTCTGPREEFEATLRRFREIAAEMIKDGRGQEVMPREASDLIGPPHAMTAYRFDSLTGRLTDDDMFSSDLTDQELRGRLGHVAVPALLAVSLDDEYVPRDVDARALARRMGEAMAIGPIGRSEVLPIEEGGHALRTPAAKLDFVDAARAFLKRQQAGGPRLSWELAAVQLIRERAAEVQGRPLMVALVGMPGAGKSTAALVLERLLGPDSLVVPMDGFHEPLKNLRKRPDSEDLVYRRGAPDTFDASSLKNALRMIRDESSAAKVGLPGFDHAAGDPTVDAVTFDRSLHRIVLVEGLYLLHDEDGFAGTEDFFDYRIYLDADLDQCIARLKERNKSIPGYTAEEIEKRCEVVDRGNAVIVQKSKPRADTVVVSGATATLSSSVAA